MFVFFKYRGVNLITSSTNKLINSAAKWRIPTRIWTRIILTQKIVLTPHKMGLIVDHSLQINNPTVK